MSQTAPLFPPLFWRPRIGRILIASAALVGYADADADAAAADAAAGTAAAGTAAATGTAAAAGTTVAATAAAGG